MSKNRLLVEGDSDKGFIQKLCDRIFGRNAVTVTVLAPKDVGANQNGWRSVIDNLPISIEDLTQERIDKLGIVLDADYAPDNSGGFRSRLQVVVDALVSHGYTLSGGNPNVSNGDMFTHNDGLPPIGLWIMPNHQDDGMIEGFIEMMITSANEQQELLAHANTTVASLPHTLFDSKLHTIKSKLHTWLAWQKKPAQLYTVLDAGILDQSKVTNFETWLRKVFP